jgi:hypothetical protein
VRELEYQAENVRGREREYQSGTLVPSSDVPFGLSKERFFELSTTPRQANGV